MPPCIELLAGSPGLRARIGRRETLPACEIPVAFNVSILRGFMVFLGFRLASCYVPGFMLYADFSGFMVYSRLHGLFTTSWFIHGFMVYAQLQGLFTASWFMIGFML
ncbi:hypothetical protein DFH09DRAFT_1082753 [Mycena vulgaris]|nr:hypothetical protein DFH09DRAFT_1082753 [Mycena vulgaris]